MNRTINGALSFGVITWACCATSMAATFTWNNANTTGNYSVASNWIGGIAPPSDNTANIVIDGETGTNVVVTLNTNASIDTLDVSSGDTIVASSGTRIFTLQNAATSGVFNNAGTLRADGAGFYLRGNSGTANTNSGIFEAINGGTFRFDSGEDNFTINNSGGIIRAINGDIALRNMETSPCEIKILP